MGKTFQNLKGTYDYLPEQQLLREYITQTLKSIFIKYGFAPAETSILCGYDLLASKYSEGADILNEMYKLSDQGKRELGLRYDLTITFSKLISSNQNITLPFKRYEIGKVFRDGPVKLGRNREFTQCDIDVVGEDSLLAEAEYMTMTEEAYRELGLEIEILFNNRKLLGGIIQAVFGEIDEDLLRKSIMLIDKFEKLSKDELHEEFSKIGVNRTKVDEIRALLKLDYATLTSNLAEYPNNELISAGLREIGELQNYLKGTKASLCLVFAPYLARGIDVYTATVWEVYCKQKRVGNMDFNISMGGGGRYDNIITSFVDDGNEYPAVGMSFGLDVIYEYLKLQRDAKTVSVVDLYVIPIDVQQQAFYFVTELRNIGAKVEMEKQQRKVKKSMNCANKGNIPFIAVLGEQEILEQYIDIKNMATGVSSRFPMHDYEQISRFVSNGG